MRRVLLPAGNDAWVEGPRLSVDPRWADSQRALHAGPGRWSWGCRRCHRHSPGAAGTCRLLSRILPSVPDRVVMSMARRLELIDWAHRAKA